MMENIQLKIFKIDENNLEEKIEILRNYSDNIYNLKCENGTLFISYEKESDIENYIFKKIFKTDYDGIEDYINWKKDNIGNVETTLKIDLDSKRLDLIYDIANKLKILKNYLKIKLIDVRETANGMHIKIRVYGIKNSLEIVFLQLLLYSDKVRETLNYVRAKKLKDVQKFERFNILFLVKYKDGKIVSVEKFRKDLTKMLWSMVK